MIDEELRQKRRKSEPVIRNKENQKMETTLRTDENECSDKMNVREVERELEKEIHRREKAK